MKGITETAIILQVVFEPTNQPEIPKSDNFHNVIPKFQPVKEQYLNTKWKPGREKKIGVVLKQFAAQMQML